MQVYVVSDLAYGYDKDRTPYWRPSAVLDSIIQAKAWAMHGRSIITVHELPEAIEAFQTKKLPDIYTVVAAA